MQLRGAMMAVCRGEFVSLALGAIEAPLNILIRPDAFYTENEHIGETVTRYF